MHSASTSKFEKVKAEFQSKINYALQCNWYTFVVVLTQLGLLHVIIRFANSAAAMETGFARAGFASVTAGQVEFLKLIYISAVGKIQLLL